MGARGEGEGRAAHPAQARKVGAGVFVFVHNLDGFAIEEEPQRDDDGQGL
jgi:hypothetical protein